MSITTKKITVSAVPAVPEKIIDKETGFKCDYCGRTCFEEYSGEDSPNWRGGYDHDVVVIRRSEGEDYPECHDRKIEEWDICPDCFDKHIRPILPKVSRKHEVNW